MYSILARCWYFSNSPDNRVAAFFDALVALIHRAGFPREFVKRVAKRWLSDWSPKLRKCIRGDAHRAESSHDFEQALLHFDRL